MKSEIEIKLSTIADIWNFHIWEHRECHKHIKFTVEARTNYFGDILGYFKDTFDIVFAERESSFSNNISLLQVIYIHQDFIEELLDLFKCKIDKGKLYQDKNYSINRNLRNELVGHPFRKQKGKFISSTVFSYHPKPGHLDYLRYHVDNDYKFETISYKISEIINRHKEFLTLYLDKILNRLKNILFKFIREIEKIENLVNKVDFEKLIKILTIKFESLFGNKTYLYEKEELLIIYKKKNEHIRYQNIIDNFYKDLKKALLESKETIIDYFTEKEQISIEKPIIPQISFVNRSSNKNIIKQSETKRSYQYELGKLCQKKHFNDFSGFLNDACKENKKVALEVENMRCNLTDDIEYYSSYYLLKKLLDN
jgi:hypothetical protein